jgi:hypothetical protein
VSDLLDLAVAEAVGSISPRPGFASELLVALRGTPALPVRFADDPDRRRPRWLLPGTFAGAVGAAGVVCYELGRRHRDKKRRATKRPWTPSNPRRRSR